MLAKFMLMLLLKLMPLITPELKETIDKGIEDLEAMAKRTPNKFDDVFVDLLKTLFDK